MFESSQKRAKATVEAELHLEDGAQLLCRVGVSQGQRLSDALNDERAFLPVETTQGHIIILRKDTITKAVQLDQHIETAKASNPYEVLGVSRTISDDELNRAYRSLTMANHPDKLLAAGMSQQFVELANSRMMRINDAYARIQAARKAALEQEAAC